MALISCFPAGGSAPIQEVASGSVYLSGQVSFSIPGLDAVVGHKNFVLTLTNRNQFSRCHFYLFDSTAAVKAFMVYAASSAVSYPSPTLASSPPTYVGDYYGSGYKANVTITTNGGTVSITVQQNTDKAGNYEWHVYA